MLSAGSAPELRMGLLPVAPLAALEGLEEEECWRRAVSRDPSLRRSLALSRDPSRAPLLLCDRSGVLLGGPLEPVGAPEPKPIGGAGGGSWSFGRDEVTRPWGKPLSRGADADCSCLALL